MFKKLKTLGQNIKHEVKVYQRVLEDRRTPKIAKCLLGLAVGYVLLPFDIIPDFMPVLGHLDDLIIIPPLAVIALNGYVLMRLSSGNQHFSLSAIFASL